MGHQFGIELRGVGAVLAPLRVAGCLRVFEHRVHGQVACTDLAQTKHVIQDGLATRLLLCYIHSRLIDLGVSQK